MKILTTLAAGFAAIIACSLPLQAGSTFSPCVAGTVSSYESLSVEGGGCTVGILVFTAFDFSHILNNQTVNDPDQITLTPTNGGFDFTQTSDSIVPIPLQVGPNDTAIYDIFFHYFVDPGPRTDGADMSMDPPFGNATVTQFFCNESTLSFNSDNNPVCSGVGAAPPPLQSFSVHNPEPLVNSITFSFPSAEGDVLTRIRLTGNGTIGAGFDSLSATQSIIDTTPEPVSMTLAFGGLLGIALLRRRV